MKNNILEIKDPSKVFFTSDLHFGHGNIINFCNRPYKNVDEMNKALINNWNSIVPEDGIVFDLGDFAFAANSVWKDILSCLNGKHYLILGNHDITRCLSQPVLDLFAGIYQQLYLRIDNRYVYLNHYPFLCYGGSYKEPQNAVWQLFGHTHSGPFSMGKDINRLVYLFPYQYDVGIDNNNYKPVSWKQVKEIINKQVENYV